MKNGATVGMIKKGFESSWCSNETLFIILNSISPGTKRLITTPDNHKCVKLCVKMIHFYQQVRDLSETVTSASVEQSNKTTPGSFSPFLRRHGNEPRAIAGRRGVVPSGTFWTHKP